MELQEAIANRRSYKKYKRDMQIDDDALHEAIKQAADAPNHKFREPWKVVHVTKDHLGDMSKQLSQIAYPNDPEKQQNHYNDVTKLGGMLVVTAQQDPRQKQNLENFMAVGAFTQNLLLLLHEAGIGSCWKTPTFIFNPEVKEMFNVAADESIVGFIYLTDMEERVMHRKRHTDDIIRTF
ncbi:nitroreductase [Staphylococcus auricularis]|uniref:Nitroreductase n=1 Tax=Staphylococcus auricularis TaxID=29379 RepID=A0AAP8PQI5_9STAP|nr:nitroreductase [Staphylococcus auricularis]PNZ67710.1 nitroreductase [Staphylococcus auricularis]QPT05771.1 nitroreductase [Staphylococcus auricularis]BCU51749.1 nitroreductase [Staphylococcus auricularis]SQJ07468.1 nitroreductase [Staphylococcus auricularis]